VLSRVQTYLADFRQNEIPDGYTMKYTGEQEDQEQAFSFLLFALGAGIMFIFLVTVAKFNSLAAPLIVLLAVGLSQIGVVLTLAVSQTPFGLMVFIGIISLFGILVNNNIVLLDYIQQLRDQGDSDRASIINGSVDRLRPVLLTALTTILALIPLTFGLNVDFIGLLAELDPAFQFGSENTQFWSPMGTSIIGGLIFALFLTLVVVPVIYSAFESFGRWSLRTLRRS
jgi:multidrug efflux pump subunit AcrB